MPPNYWMLVDSMENFRSTRERDFKVQGVKTRQRKKGQRMEPGDRLLYYLSDVQRFAGTATITSTYFEDHSRVWKDAKPTEDFPFRVEIKPEAILEEEEFMDARQVAPRLDYVRRWPPERWPLAFIGNLHLIPKKDFFLIEDEMKKQINKRAPESLQGVS